MSEIYDVVVIGGGQSGLACGYYLRRTGLNYIILDDQQQCGGAWQHVWKSLTLFSPAEYSSLPGWLMPKSENRYPSRQEVINYLCKYEQRYQLHVKRPVKVESVEKDDLFYIKTNEGEIFSKTIISATGTWSEPFIPAIAGRESFKGEQLHSAEYKHPDDYNGKKVLIVGEGNTGAQLLSEISKVTECAWAVKKEPDFLPDDVDGHVLFNVASAKYYAEKEGKPFEPKNYSLGNIVMVPSVKDARDRNVLHAKGIIRELYPNGVVWKSGEKEEFDSIIWCTGFNYSTGHLKKLATTDKRGKLKTTETKAEDVPGLWLVGYGGWTGFASATLIGVGRSARATIKEIEDFLKGK